MAENEKTYVGPITNITDNGKDYYISLENIPAIQDKIGEIINSLAVKEAADETKTDAERHAVYTVEQKKHLEALYTSLTADDENNVIDTLKEILAFFNGTEEGKTLVNFIAGLNVEQIGSDGNYIKFVSQTNGKIAAIIQAFEPSIAETSASPSTTNAPTAKAVRDAIDALDVASVGSDGGYIKVISETDGKISATRQAFDTSINSSSLSTTNAPTSKAVKAYVDTSINNLNIENGATTGSLEQVFDGSTFNFVNPNSPLDGTTVNIGIATGTYAAMLGGKGRVEGKRSFVNGTQVVATGNYAHAEGNNAHAAGVNSHAEGIQTYASGSAAHAEGSSTAATETGAHSEGYGTHADGVYTHAEGAMNYVLGDNSHAEGGRNIIGVYSGPSPEPGPAPEPGTAIHAEGMGSHAEGNNNTITGYYSHAEGQGNTVSSNRAHAEGNGNTVSGLYAHAEGNGGAATGEGAHSEGLYGHAIGNYSHAEGAATYANGLYSHAAGQNSAANGVASFASGYHLAANRDYQTVVGKYNLGQNDILFEVGNGTAENARSNAFEVYKDGHAEIGLMGTTNLSVTTKGYVDAITSGTTSFSSIKIGNTTINEAQLIKLLALLDSLETTGE